MTDKSSDKDVETAVAESSRSAPSRSPGPGQFLPATSLGKDANNFNIANIASLDAPTRPGGKDVRIESKTVTRRDRVEPATFAELLSASVAVGGGSSGSDAEKTPLANHARELLDEVVRFARNRPLVAFGGVACVAAVGIGLYLLTRGANER